MDRYHIEGMLAVEIEELVDKLMIEFEKFTHGVRVCMLIDRSVGNSHKGSKRWVNKLISYDIEGLRKNIGKLLHQQKYLDNPDIRLYMSVNARNLSKAIKKFNHRQIDLVPSETEKFYSRINDSFVSALMSPECKGEKFFILDWDVRAKDSPDSPWSSVEIMRYRTPNGTHIVTKPFNTVGSVFSLYSCLEIKKDALLLLHTLGFNPIHADGGIFLG